MSSGMARSLDGWFRDRRARLYALRGAGSPPGMPSRPPRATSPTPLRRAARVGGLDHGPRTREHGGRGTNHLLRRPSGSVPPTMVIERSMHPQFLSNTYLVGEPGGAGFFVDAGGPVSPLIAAAER